MWIKFIDDVTFVGACTKQTLSYIWRTGLVGEDSFVTHFTFCVLDSALGRVLILILFPLTVQPLRMILQNCDKWTHIRCRGSGQEDVNWLEVVQPLQSVCHSEAREGSETETDQDREQKMKEWNRYEVTFKTCVVVVPVSKQSKRLLLQQR